MFNKIPTNVIKILFLFSTTIFTHEYWILPEKVSLGLNKKTKLFICGGHKFPKSEFVLSDRIFSGIKVLGPEILQHCSYKNEHNFKSCEISFSSPGIYTLYFQIYKLPSKIPVYTAKTYVYVENKDLPFLEPETELKIVPEDNIFKLRVKDKVRFKIYYKSSPIKTRVTIHPENGKSFHTVSDSSGNIRFDLLYPGWYMVSVTHKGLGYSLTFFVN